MNCYSEAIEMIFKLKEDYNFLVDKNINISSQLSYLKEAIELLGLTEQVENKINEIKENELPF